MQIDGSGMWKAITGRHRLDHSNTLPLIDIYYIKCAGITQIDVDQRKNPGYYQPWIHLLM